MLTLFKIFANQSLKTWVYYTGLTLLLQFLLNGFQKELLIALTVFSPLIGLYLFSSQSRTIFAPNIGFLLTLPITKKNIVLLKGLFVLFNFVCYSFAAVIIALIGMYFSKEYHRPEDYIKVLQNVSNFVTPTIFVLGLSVLFGASFGMRIPLSELRHLLFPKNTASKYFFPAILIISLIFLFKKSQFLLMAFIILGAMLWPVYGITVSIALAKKARRQVIWSTFFLAFIPIAIIYQNLLSKALDINSTQQIKAIEDLGFLMADIPQSMLAQKISKNPTKLIDQNESFDLIRFYLERFHHSKAIAKGKDPYLSFSKIILQDNCNFVCVKKIQSMFKTKDLDANDLTILFNKLTIIAQMNPLKNTFSLSPHEDFYHLLQLLPAQVLVGDLLPLLESKNEIKIKFALLKSRYVRDAVLIPAIEKNITDYSEANRMLALHTLSILYGQYLGLDHWANFKNTGKFLAAGAHFYSVNCEQFDFKKTLDVAAQNVCVREKFSKNNFPSLRYGDLENYRWHELAQANLLEKTSKN